MFNFVLAFLATLAYDVGVSSTILEHAVRDFVRWLRSGHRAGQERDCEIGYDDLELDVFDRAEGETEQLGRCRSMAIDIESGMPVPWDSVSSGDEERRCLLLDSPEVEVHPNYPQAHSLNDDEVHLLSEAECCSNDKSACEALSSCIQWDIASWPRSSDPNAEIHQAQQDDRNGFNRGVVITEQPTPRDVITEQPKPRVEFREQKLFNDTHTNQPSTIVNIEASQRQTSLQSVACTSESVACTSEGYWSLDKAGLNKRAVEFTFQQSGELGEIDATNVSCCHMELDREGMCKPDSIIPVPDVRVDDSEPDDAEGGATSAEYQPSAVQIQFPPNYKDSYASCSYGTLLHDEEALKALQENVNEIKVILQGLASQVCSQKDPKIEGGDTTEYSIQEQMDFACIMEEGIEPVNTGVPQGDKLGPVHFSGIDTYQTQEQSGKRSHGTPCFAQEEAGSVIGMPQGFMLGHEEEMAIAGESEYFKIYDSMSGDLQAIRVGLERLELTMQVMELEEESEEQDEGCHATGIS